MSLASRKLIQAAAGATTVDTGDDDFANVVLLLDGDGTDQDDNTQFSDSSGNSVSISRNGNVPNGSVSPYGDNWSNYFNAADERLDFTPSFSLGSNDFTIEMWVNPIAASASSLESFFWLESSTNEFLVFRIDNNSNRGLEFRVYNFGNAVFLRQGSDYLENGEWVHVAATKSGSTYNFFVNGTSIGTATYATALTSYSNGHIGAWTSVAQDYAGYISNVRVVNGTALYTSNFTPPTSYLTAVTNTVLLTCQSNRFVDNSSSPHTLTVQELPKVTRFSPFKSGVQRDITVDGGSAYFDLATTYLTYSGGNSSNSTLTLSFWIYATGSMNTNGGLYPRVFCSASNAFLIYLRTDDIRIYNGGEKIQTPLTRYEWHYFVAQLNGSQWEMWLDGVSKGTNTSTGSNINLNSTNYIGRDATNAAYFGGFLSDFKITEGVEYSDGASFTPPTSPVSAGSSAVLLNFQDAGIYDLAGMSNFYTTGSCEVDTAVKKYGTGSIKFDGDNDELVNSNGDGSHVFHIADADFTVELWANASAAGTNVFIGNGIVSSAANSNWWIETVGGVLKVYISNGSSYTIISDTVSWSSYSGFVHIAWVNYNGTSSLYINGTSKASATTPSTNDAMANELFIGGMENSFEINGNLDDIRITKGVARYTADFTPPTEELLKF
jgi:hypothetical protein